MDVSWAGSQARLFLISVNYLDKARTLVWYLPLTSLLLPSFVYKGPLHYRQGKTQRTIGLLLFHSEK